MEPAGEWEHLNADHRPELRQFFGSQGLFPVGAQVQAQLRHCRQGVARQLLLACFFCAHPRTSQQARLFQVQTHDTNPYGTVSVCSSEKMAVNAIASDPFGQCRQYVGRYMIGRARYWQRFWNKHKLRPYN